MFAAIPSTLASHVGSVVRVGVKMTAVGGKEVAAGGTGAAVGGSGVAVTTTTRGSPAHADSTKPSASMSSSFFKSSISLDKHNIPKMQLETPSIGCKLSGPT